MGRGHSAIVIGGGHNGLVAAFYLAQTGANVLVLERRDFVGGACVTEELFPGFRVSSCSYVCHLLQEKVINDMGIVKQGFRVFPLEPFRFHPFPNGQYILNWHDNERTIEAIRRISPNDANRFTDWAYFWKKASGILYRYFLTDPPTYSEVAADVRGTADEKVFERMLTGNMFDLVEEFFKSEQVKGAFIEAQDAGDIRAPGSIMSAAYFKCSQFTNQKFLGIPKGGMGGITVAMSRAAKSNGVEIRTGTEVKRIIVKKNKVRGVLMAGGEEIEASIILSNADPKRTFLNLIDPEEMKPSFVEDIRRLKTQISCLKFHCSLRRLPDFSSYLGSNFDPKNLAQIRICPSVSYFQQSWEDARNGRLSRYPIMYIQIPSVYDPTLAPPGQHVMSVWSLYAPVVLKNESWDKAKKQAGEKLIDTIAQYAPSIRNDIIDWEIFTPKDLEQRVYLTDGNIRHLDIIPEQMLARRPNRQLSGYQTPVEGLYLCGSGTHPGGEVTGAPGHNAAKAVIREWQNT